MDRTWRKTLAKNLRKISPERAKEIIAAHSKVGAQVKGIGDPAIRELTGGFSSQAIDATVLRKLGVVAGYIRNSK